MPKTLNAVPGVAVVELAGVDPDGRPRVRWGPAPDQVRVAATVWMGKEFDWSAHEGSKAVVGFEDGDVSRPILLGLLGPPTRRPATATEHTEPRVLQIHASEELTLSCGSARINLRADGRVLIRGEHVVSRSKGPNKIKGGTVQLN